MSSPRYVIELDSDQDELLQFLMSDEVVSPPISPKQPIVESPPVSPSSRSSARFAMPPLIKRLSFISTKNRFDEDDSRSNPGSARNIKVKPLDDILSEIAEEHDQMNAGVYKSPRLGSSK